ncbi:MAG TPA: hypothetical protein VM103_02650 [Candidatus Paceibacterota bacterium]|nr:hypothetical protein [Candidatus Paceibacterota bacterium]
MQTPQRIMRKVLAAVIRKARAAGCKVETVRPNRFSGHVSRRTLLVNEHLCSVHQVTKKSQPERAKRFYARVVVTYKKLEKVAALIFHVTIDGLPQRDFVIPSRVLRAALFGSNPTCDRKTLYLPLERLPSYHMRKPAINYWNYEGAWDRVR